KQLPAIQTSMYSELVSRGYFKVSPQTTRNNAIGIGVIALIALTILAFAVFSIGIFTGFVLAITLGIGLIVLGNSLPAKTEAGGKMLMEIKGFKMYLETAEKYRVQNLTPETFEKYLSYAMVFGIEKQWAEKFKNIYLTPPTWYEGGDW